MKLYAVSAWYEYEGHEEPESVFDTREAAEKEVERLSAMDIKIYRPFGFEITELELNKPSERKP